MKHANFSLKVREKNAQQKFLDEKRDRENDKTEFNACIV
jgi:hypothetical protein